MAKREAWSLLLSPEALVVFSLHAICEDGLSSPDATTSSIISFPPLPRFVIVACMTRLQWWLLNLSLANGQKIHLLLRVNTVDSDVCRSVGRCSGREGQELGQKLRQPYATKRKQAVELSFVARTLQRFTGAEPTLGEAPIHTGVCLMPSGSARGR